MMITFSRWSTATKSKEEWNSWQEVEGSNSYTHCHSWNFL